MPLDVSDAEAKPVGQLLHGLVNPFSAADHSAAGDKASPDLLIQQCRTGSHRVRNVLHEKAGHLRGCLRGVA